MKKIYLIAFIILLCQSVFASISLEGIYFGKNLIIQNQESPDGFGFCVQRVTINGDLYPGVITKSVFEIDFSMFQLSIGEPIFIVIEHIKNCIPKIINPEVLLPISKFEIVKISASNDGKLNWTTKNEDGKLPFLIQQYRWNKWVTIGEVNGKGGMNENSYEFEVIPHQGINKVRVIQIDQTSKERISNEVKFHSKTPEVFLISKTVKTEIKFISNEKIVKTKYEILDAYGNILKKGFAESVNCKNLLKGAYFINYDNKTETFLKL